MECPGNDVLQTAKLFAFLQSELMECFGVALEHQHHPTQQRRGISVVHHPGVPIEDNGARRDPFNTADGTADHAIMTVGHASVRSSFTAKRTAHSWHS